MIEMLPHDRLVLETERLWLTPLTTEDLDIVQALLCDAEVMRYVADEPMSHAAVEEEMPLSTRRGGGGRIGIWCVTRKDTGERIGDGVLMPVPIEEEEYDWLALRPEVFPQEQIEVGYLLVPSAWGQGFATEICTRLLRFAFEETDLPSVVATTDPENAKSQHVLGKCGLRGLGKKRAYAWDDVSWFEITRAEWMAQASNQ